MEPLSTGRAYGYANGEVVIIWHAPIEHPGLSPEQRVTRHVRKQQVDKLLSSAGPRDPADPPAHQIMSNAHFSITPAGTFGFRKGGARVHEEWRYEVPDPGARQQGTPDATRTEVHFRPKKFDQRPPELGVTDWYEVKRVDLFNTVVGW